MKEFERGARELAAADLKPIAGLNEFRYSYLLDRKHSHGGGALFAWGFMRGSVFVLSQTAADPSPLPHHSSTPAAGS